MAEREDVAESLRRWGWELGNDGAPRAEQRKYPRLPLWTAHHPQAGVLGALCPDGLVEYVQHAHRTMLAVSEAGYELVRGTVDSPTSGWWVCKDGRQIVMFASGDVSDLCFVSAWLKVVRSMPAEVPHG